MLTFDEFHNLSMEKKCSLVTFNGRFLALKKFEKKRVYLFYLAGIFVEIWFSEKGIVENVIAFKDGKGLEFYAEEVNIDELLNLIN